MLTMVQQPIQAKGEAQLREYENKVGLAKQELRDIVADLAMALTGKEVVFAEQLEEVRKEAAAKIEASKPIMHLRFMVEDVSFCDPVGLSSPTTDSLNSVTCEECLEVYKTSPDDVKAGVQA